MKIIARKAAAVLMTLAMVGMARAETAGILHATLAERDQKTQEVSTDELRRILRDSSAVVLDTRGRAEFDAGHIPGARNLDAPASELVATVERLVNGDKAKALVLYCNGPFCQASRRAGEQLVAAGFSNVRRYQLGMPVWRALGGPTVIEFDGITRIAKADRTAVFIDARSRTEFTSGTLVGAKSAPLDELISGALQKVPLPEDDFNRRVVLFGRDGEQSRKLAEMMSKRPWHNVTYYPGSFETLAAGLKE